MPDERKQSLLIIAYPGKETADAVYDVLRTLEKQDTIDIKTAVTLYRKENGQLLLKYRKRLTIWKDDFGCGAISLLLAGTGDDALGGTIVGALIGSRRSKQYREGKAFLDDKLGVDDSALAILVSNAGWEAVNSEIEQFGGEQLAVELTPEAERWLAEIAADEEVAAVVREEVEIVEVTLIGSYPVNHEAQGSF